MVVVYSLFQFIICNIRKNKRPFKPSIIENYRHHSSPEVVFLKNLNVQQGSCGLVLQKKCLYHSLFHVLEWQKIYDRRRKDTVSFCGWNLFEFCFLSYQSFPWNIRYLSFFPIIISPNLFTVCNIIWIHGVVWYSCPLSFSSLLFFLGWQRVSSDSKPTIKCKMKSVYYYYYIKDNRARGPAFFHKGHIIWP